MLTPNQKKTRDRGRMMRSSGVLVDALEGGQEKRAPGEQQLDPLRQSRDHLNLKEHRLVSSLLYSPAGGGSVVEATFRNPAVLVGRLGRFDDALGFSGPLVHVKGT